MVMTFYLANAKRGAGKGPVQIVPFADHDDLAPIGADAPVLADPRFRVEEGVKWNDFLPFTYGSHMALSEKVKKLFDEHAVQGVNLHAIDIEGAEQAYFIYRMTSIVPRWRNEEAITEYETDIHEIDMSSYGGEDVFTVQGTLLELYSERLVAILKKAKVKGLDASPFRIRDLSSQ